MARPLNVLIVALAVPAVCGVGWLAWKSAHPPPVVIEASSAPNDGIDKQEFGTAMLDEARAENPSADIRLDEKRFVLTWKEGEAKGEYHLEGTYRDYLNAAPVDRMPLMHRRAATIKGLPLPATLAEAEPHLVPIVRERIGFEVARIFASKNPEKELPPEPPHVTLTDDLWGVLAYETDEQFLRLDAATLTRWNARFEELWPKAIQRLEAKSGSFIEPSRRGIREIDFNDENDSARVLLPSVFAKLAIGGDAVVAIPKDDLFLLVAANDAPGVDALVERVTREWDRGGQNSRLFRVDPGGAIGPFLDPRASVVDLVHAAEQRDEELQREALRSHYGDAEDAPFVATLKRMKNPTTNDELRFAVHTENTPTLLPKADWIVYRRVDLTNHTASTLACGTWDRVYALMKTRWKETPLHPKRWLANDLPTPKELADLGCDNPALKGP